MLAELANKAGSMTCVSATRPHPAAELRARPHYAIAPSYAVKTTQHPNQLLNYLKELLAYLGSIQNLNPLPKIMGGLKG